MAQIRETETTDEVIRETRRITAALAESWISISIAFFRVRRAGN